MQPAAEWFPSRRVPRRIAKKVSQRANMRHYAPPGFRQRIHPTSDRPWAWRAFVEMATFEGARFRRRSR